VKQKDDKQLRLIIATDI